ncbi:MAG: cytochrome c [Alphaproteobacteria bacterium]|nr:cytochrome c [Alphaproteobacteria bacterium]
MAAKSTFALIAVAVLAVGGYAYLNTSTPGMTPEEPLKDAQYGEPMAKVIVPELTGRAVIGEAAFNAKCAVCHGQNAAGQEGIAPPLIHKFYRPGHHGEEAFQRAAKGGVISHHWTFGNMPPIEGVTPGDVKAIVAYIRVLQQANGIN